MKYLRLALIPFALCLLTNFSPAQADGNLLLTARYLVKIHNRVQNHWKPKGIPLMDLHRRGATMRLWLKKDGQLRRIKVVQSSGHKKFDKSLLKAISKAIPFPKPPKPLIATARNKGFEIVFRRRVFKKKKLPLNRKYKGSSVLYDWQKKKKDKKTKPKSR